MPVARGVEVYNADSAPVLARGYQYIQGDLESARPEIDRVLGDQAGRDILADLYNGLQLTGFGTEMVIEALQATPEEEHSRGWREGEALAEAWLTSHEACEFPWSLNRDLRHHRASLPGAELIGFSGVTVEESSFAFGEVKTSKETQNPPQVVNRGSTCLVNQLIRLRDDAQIKTTIVNYLGYRAATGVSWATKFHVAATRYFNSGMTNVKIFGVLVRDVRPVSEDLAEAARSLCSGCPPLSNIKLVGLYLPLGGIPEGPQHGPRRRRS